MKTAILGLFCVHFFRAVSCKGPSKNDVNSFSDFLNLPSPISTTFYYFPVLNNVAARNSLETRKICLHISIVLPVLELYIIKAETTIKFGCFTRNPLQVFVCCITDGLHYMIRQNFPSIFDTFSHFPTHCVLRWVLRGHFLGIKMHATVKLISELISIKF